MHRAVLAISPNNPVLRSSELRKLVSGNPAYYSTTVDV
jgi:hypothetical protein